MRFYRFIVLLGGLMLFTGPAMAKIDLSAYNSAYRGIVFGMSLDSFMDICRSRLKAKYGEKIAATTDASEKDRLTQQEDAALKALNTWIVRFTKTNRTWNASVLAGEFINGRGEEMVVSHLSPVKRYFFFHNNKLAKVIEIGTQPFATYMFRFSNAYGKPKVVRYQGNQVRKPSEILWEDQNTRFSIKNIGQPFNCIILRWAQKAEDDKWRALRAKLQKKNNGVNQIVKEVQGKQKDSSVDRKLDELLGPGKAGGAKPAPMQPLVP